MRRWFETVTQDLGYALRSFKRSPAFVGVALLSLMLGIGATTAIFSVIYGVLISPYPYARPGEIWSPEVRAIEGRGGHGVHARRASEAGRRAGLLGCDGDVDRDRPDDRRVRAGELQRRAADGECVQLPRRATASRPHDSTIRRPHERRCRTRGGPQPAAVAPALRGESLRDRAHAAPQRPSLHHHRGHASALWLVRQRGILAAVVSHADRPPVHQSDRAAHARNIPARRRRAAEGPERAPCARDAGAVSSAWLHDGAAELSGRDRRQRRNADQPSAAAGRRGVPPADRVRERCQPAAGARDGARS